MAATPAPPPMEVASASFVHFGCNHAQLFRSKYKRSNRTKGLKILRCFPHCCPEHVDRSYCGTSLSVSIELAARPPDATRLELPPRDVLAVFARFEAVSEVTIRPGECVEVAKIAAGTQSESNLDGQWVEGMIDRPCGLVATFRRSDALADCQKLLVFHLNGKPSSRWYYDWESGANKAQRLMKHVLKAYVVERCAIDKHGYFTSPTSPHAETQLYRILRVVTSPEFTVISYRRAPTEQYRITPILTQSHQASPIGDVGTYTNDSSSTCKRNHPHSIEYRDDVGIDPATVKSEPLFEMKARQVPELPYAHGLFEDNLQWKQPNVSAASVSRNLALAYAFLRWVPGTFPDFPTQVKKFNGFTSIPLDEAGKAITNVQDGGNGSLIPLPLQLENLLRALAHAELNERLDAQVFAHTALKSLANVAEEIIAAVYTYPCLYKRRCGVRQILGGRNFVAWNAFVAQMRETYIGMSTPRGDPRALAHRYRRPGANLPQGTIGECWNAEWLLDANEVTWTSYDQAPRDNQTSTEIGNSFAAGGSPNSTYSLLTMFHVISQLARLSVSLDVEARELHARSTNNNTGAHGSMCLILDGKERVFSQFPNGMVSAVGAAEFGDYIGEVRVERLGRVAVYLQFFNWSVSRNDLSYNVRLRIECYRGQTLCVSGDVLATTAAASFLTEEEVSLWGELSLHNKLEAVSKTHARYLQELVTNESWQTRDAAGPWKEAGKFRLSYAKI